MMMEGDITDAMPVRYASRAVYDDCRARIEEHEYPPTMMHAKSMVVDGTWSMFGSANFDNRSLELNDELNIAVEPRVAVRFLSDFDAGSARIETVGDRQPREKRSILEKSRERFWSYFGKRFSSGTAGFGLWTSGLSEETRPERA